VNPHRLEGQTTFRKLQTDSEEDEEGSDVHKLAKIKHALVELSQPVQIILKGRYEWEGTWEEVSYCRTYLERTISEDILEPLRITAQKLGKLALQAGAAALVLSIQRLNAEREAIQVMVEKRGQGIQVVYEKVDQLTLPRGDYALKFRSMFPDGISLVFGTGAPVSNVEISARLKSITASWFGDQYGPSWQANLSAEPRASDLGNEIYATVLLSNDESWNGICRIPGLPSCAAPISTTVIVTKEEEATALIQHAWEANWPIKGTIALTMDVGTQQAFEFSVTYELTRIDEGPSWPGLSVMMWRAAETDGTALQPVSVENV
jgi:hypothetical protein